MSENHDFDGKNRLDRKTVIALSFCMILFFGMYFSISAHHALNGDEGVYSAGALRFADGDVMLKKVDTDKPPLVYQAQGVAAWLWGATDMSVKVPNAFALVALILLVFVLGRKLFDDKTALLAAAIFSTAPFLAERGIGAMTDPIATLFLTASLVFAFSHRGFLCGFCFAMSLLTRQMALVYLPLPLIALVFSPVPGGQKKIGPVRGITLFAVGAILPALWLLTWSAFFEREPFAWLLRELVSGKVTTGAQKAGLIERLIFWSSALSRFFVTLLIPALALAGLVLLGARRFASSKSANDKTPGSFAIWLFAGAMVYYVALHTLIGAPLYPRFLFPILPTTAVLVAFLIVRSASILFNNPGRIAKAIGWAMLGCLLVFGTRETAKQQAQPEPRDDVPQIADYLKRNFPDSAALYNYRMNRELIFYLHAKDVKLRQYKNEPDKLLEFANTDAGRKRLVAIKKTDPVKISELQNAVLPNYKLQPIYETSRGALTLYEVVTNAKTVMLEGNLYLQRTQSENTDLVPITADSVQYGLMAFAKRTLKSDGIPEVSVTPYEDGRIEQGRFKKISITVPNPVVQKITTETMTLIYEDVQIDLAALLIANHLIIQKSRRAWGKIVAGGDGVSKFLQMKNPNIKDMKVQTQDGKVVITGQAGVFGKMFGIEITGTLSPDEKGQVFLLPESGKLAGHTLPGFVLSLVGNAVNPTFRTELDAFDLRGIAVDLENNKLVFTLG